MMSKAASVSQVQQNKSDVKQLVKVTTYMAWTALIIGTVLSLFNIGYFSDKNVGLMIGIGFLIGSVHIYVIGTAISLVHARTRQEEQDNETNTQ